MVSPAALRSRDFRRTTLGERHRRVVRALTEAFFTDDVPLAAERLDAFVVDIDDHMSRASKTLRFGLVLMIETLHLLPLVLVRRFMFFDELSIEDRVTMLRRMDRSSFALFPLIIVAFKTLLTMGWFEDEAMLRSMGYPGEARERYKRSLPLAKAEATE